MSEQKVLELLAACSRAQGGERSRLDYELKRAALEEVGAPVWRWISAQTSAADAEDLYQDTCLAICRSLERFRGDSKLKTWALRIARNRWSSLVRDERLHRRLMEDNFPTEDEHRAILKSRGTTPSEDARRKQELERRESILQKAIAAGALTPSDVDLLAYTYMLELDKDAVCELLEIDDGARRKRLSRANKKFAEFATRRSRPASRAPR